MTRQNRAVRLLLLLALLFSSAVALADGPPVKATHLVDVAGPQSQSRVPPPELPSASLPGGQESASRYDGNQQAIAASLRQEHATLALPQVDTLRLDSLENQDLKDLLSTLKANQIEPRDGTAMSMIQNGRTIFVIPLHDLPDPNHVLYLFYLNDNSTPYFVQVGPNRANKRELRMWSAGPSELVFSQDEIALFPERSIMRFSLLPTRVRAEGLVATPLSTSDTLACLWCTAFGGVAPSIGSVTSRLLSGTCVGTTQLVTLMTAYTCLSIPDPVAIAGCGFGLAQIATCGLANCNPDYSLVGSPSSTTITTGQTANYSIAATFVCPFSGPVNGLSVLGLPSGASATFAPSAINASGQAATLNISTNSSTQTGTRTLTVTAQGGGKTRSTTVALTVNPLPDFSLSVTPAAQTIRRGQTTTFTVSASFLGGFTGPVNNFSVGNLPSGASGVFSPTSISSSVTGTKLTITTNSTTSTGTRVLTISANGAGKAKSIAVTLTVNP